jgi:sn-glycerol 3-phosphate transport system permease protein
MVGQQLAPAAFRSKRDRRLGLLLTLPALAVFVIFTYYPFFKNFVLGLYQAAPYPTLPNKYVGLSQFTTMLHSGQFWDSLRSTGLFVLFTVPLGVAGGLAMAVLAHQKLRGIRVFRTIFSSTVVSSVAVASVIFATLLSPVTGYLPAIGIHVPDISSSSTWAMPMVSIVSAWQFVGLAFIILTAGMQSLPEEVLEASRVDGASAWTRFWRVTLPLLSPTIFFTVVVGVIFGLNSFGQIDIMVGYQNAAFTHTNVLIYFIYQLIHVQSNPGLAACYSIALFFVTLVVTVVQFRLLERRVHYGS